jgi:hypothetical protein
VGVLGALMLLLQGFMNWNALRHVPGSGADPAADTIKVIMDKRGNFSSMVMVIHAGNDHMFWQVGVLDTEMCVGVLIAVCAVFAVSRHCL